VQATGCGLIRALPDYLSNGILFGKPLTFEQME
jgi:hypothetical protein